MNDNYFAAYEAKLAAMAAMQAEVLPLNKRALFDALALAGIQSVVVTFDGYGDSGQIESVEALADSNQTMDIPPVAIELREVLSDGPTVAIGPRSIREAIEIMTYELLEQTHDGWENDEGGHAEFTFDVARQTIVLDYEERYTASNEYWHKF